MYAFQIGFCVKEANEKAGTRLFCMLFRKEVRSGYKKYRKNNKTDKDKRNLVYLPDFFPI